MSSLTSAWITKMPNDLTVAIASGKGGTGKTTIAVNITRSLADSDKKVRYIDCDVEEPNGHIFLKPDKISRVDVTVDVPQVDLEKCTACGECGKICRFNAIVCIKEHVLTFEELCHSCGGCRRVCPTDAIRKKPVKIGVIETGKAGKIEFASGKLSIGNVRTPKLISYVKKQIKRDCVTVIDVPPGTTCPTVEAVKNTDYVIMVTEPTPFGLNDLRLAVEMVRLLNIPFSVIINRYGLGDDKVEKYCRDENIDIVMKLPDDRRIAETYSEGRMILDALPEYKEQFKQLCDYLEDVTEKLDEKRRLRI
jgi:MinD superfamily P-loop ATPase